MTEDPEPVWRRGVKAGALCSPPMRLLLILLLALAGPMPAAAQQLNVAAAASLTEAMTELARAFEATRSGVSVQLRFGASGQLLQDLPRGPVTDVLATADVDTVARGVQRRLLVAEAQREFAANALVLVVPADRGTAVQRLQDLARPEIRRIAMGRIATVPAGRYAKQAIDALRLWPALQQKIVNHDDVRAVLDAVASGDVDAGFVYATDAARAGDRLRVVQTLNVPTPLRYAATVTAASRQPALAREFVLFLTQPPARALLERQGFGGP